MNLAGPLFHGVLFNMFGWGELVWQRIPLLGSEQQAFEASVLK